MEFETFRFSDVARLLQSSVHYQSLMSYPSLFATLPPEVVVQQNYLSAKGDAFWLLKYFQDIDDTMGEGDVEMLSTFASLLLDSARLDSGYSFHSLQTFKIDSSFATLVPSATERSDFLFPALFSHPFFSESIPVSLLLRISFFLKPQARQRVDARLRDFLSTVVFDQELFSAFPPFDYGEEEFSEFESVLASFAQYRPDLLPPVFMKRSFFQSRYFDTFAEFENFLAAGVFEEEDVFLPPGAALCWDQLPVSLREFFLHDYYQPLALEFLHPALSSQELHVLHSNYIKALVEGSASKTFLLSSAYTRLPFSSLLTREEVELLFDSPTFAQEAIYRADSVIFHFPALASLDDFFNLSALSWSGFADYLTDKVPSELGWQVLADPRILDRFPAPRLLSILSSSFLKNALAASGLDLVDQLEWFVAFQGLESVDWFYYPEFVSYFNIDLSSVSSPRNISVLHFPDSWFLASPEGLYQALSPSLGPSHPGSVAGGEVRFVQRVLSDLILFDSERSFDRLELIVSRFPFLRDLVRVFSPTFRDQVFADPGSFSPAVLAAFAPYRSITIPSSRVVSQLSH